MRGTKSLIVALFAIGLLAVMPSAALASPGLFATGEEDTTVKFEAEEYPHSISGPNNNGPVTLLAIPESSEFVCEKVNYLDIISEPTSEVELSPSSSTCEAAETPVTFHHNGCHYKYSELEYEGGYEYSAPSEIVCSGENEMELLVATCTIGIPAQKLSNAEAEVTESKGKDAVAMATHDTGLTYTVSGSAFPCFLLTGKFEGTYEDGTSESAFTLGGVTLGGGPARIEAKSYPREITGKRFADGESGVALLMLASPSLEFSVYCGSASINGGEISAPQLSLTLGGTYSGCGATVNMNSCSYVYSDFEYHFEDEYYAVAGISCTEEEDSIELDFGESCKVYMGPQSFGKVGGVANWTFGSGLETLVAYMETSSITYSTYLPCFLKYGWSAGVHEDGSAVHAFTLEGV